MERWRPILGGVYEISDYGRARRAAPGVNTHAGRLLKLILMKIGYYRIMPCIDGEQWPEYVHDLVAEAFIGPKPSGLSVNHIDGIKTNNHVDNLEYVTHRANMKHAGAIGVLRRCPRFTDAEVMAIKQRLESGHRTMALAAQLGVPHYAISDIRRGHSYKHVATHTK